MTRLTIRHLTTYRYRQPVGFGEHRMMLRPRDSHDQRVLEARLDITPSPTKLSFTQDVFGNHIATARFAGRADVLHFESIIELDHRPRDPFELETDGPIRGFPIAYDVDEMPDLARLIERQQPDPGNEVGTWAQRLLPAGGSIGVFELMKRMSITINGDFLYRRREAQGVQSPVETLRLGRGSCRDFAMLMIEAARSLGLAARFASGYLAVPLGESDIGGHGSTHAWAQIYLPRAGWIDFDPTCGTAGNGDLITVAVARHPSQAIPLQGTYIGLPTDYLDMMVSVMVEEADEGVVLHRSRRLAGETGIG